LRKRDDLQKREAKTGVAPFARVCYVESNTSMFHRPVMHETIEAKASFNPALQAAIQL
jgi:hypothetical protein